MFEKPRVIVTTLAGLMLLTLACGGEPADTGVAEQPDASAPASGTLSAPPLATSRGSAETLPPDHPPLQGGATAGDLLPPPPGSGTGVMGLSWTAPDGWVSETPSSGMRRAQYRVPGPGGDGECVVFYFGPGQGGDPMSNAVRWAGQFRQPDGRDSSEVLQTKQIEVGDLPVLLVEVKGTYANLMTMDEEKAGYMLLGAVAQGPDANWFFKLTGPEDSVRSQRKAFEGMVRSLKTGGS